MGDIHKESNWLHKIRLTANVIANIVCEKYDKQEKFDRIYKDVFYSIMVRIKENESFFFKRSDEPEPITSKNFLEQLAKSKYAIYSLDVAKVLKVTNRDIVPPLIKIMEAEKSKNEIEEKYESLNNEHRVSVQKLKTRRKAKSNPIINNVRETIEPGLRKKFISLITANVDDCLLKNGNVNFSKLGRKIGFSNHTAKKYYNSFYLNK